MTIKLVGIDHIVLRTNQLKTMLAFYCGVLGCVVERETSKEIGLTQLRAGHALIDLLSVDSLLGKVGGGAPTATENNLDHFCLQIAPSREEDIRHHLHKHKIKTEAFKTRYGSQGEGPSLYIKDPDGNTVELRPQIS